MVTEDDAMPPPEVALQVKVTPAVSDVTEPPSQSEPVTGESASETSQLTETSDVYQPPVPCVPLTTARIAGGERSSVSGRHSHAPRKRLGSSSVAAPTPRLPLKYGYV